METKIVKITVKKWTHKDKFPCPGCGKKLAMPDYTCDKCNIKVQPVMNF